MTAPVYKVLPLLLSLGACAAAAAPVTLTPGQTLRSGGASFTVLRVQDDRCPPRAMCLMQGKISASVMVARGGTVRTVRLSLPGKAVSTPAGSLRLGGATPRGSGKQVRLTFEVKQ